MKVVLKNFFIFYLSETIKLKYFSPDRKAPRTPDGGKTCVMLPLFEGQPNGAPFKAFHGNLDYPALGGLLEIEGEKYFCMTFLFFKPAL